MSSLKVIAMIKDSNKHEIGATFHPEYSEVSRSSMEYYEAAATKRTQSRTHQWPSSRRLPAWATFLQISILTVPSTYGFVRCLLN